MTIQLKRTLNSNITSYNPKDGEVVLDFNARNFKVGYNNESYNKLEYWIKRPIPSIYDGMNLTKEFQQYILANYKPKVLNNSSYIRLETSYTIAESKQTIKPIRTFDIKQYFDNITSTEVITITNLTFRLSDQQEKNTIANGAGSTTRYTRYSDTYMTIYDGYSGSTSNNATINITLNSNSGIITTQIASIQNMNWGNSFGGYVYIDCITNYGRINNVKFYINHKTPRW